MRILHEGSCIMLQASIARLVKLVDPDAKQHSDSLCSVCRSLQPLGGRGMTLKAMKFLSYDIKHVDMISSNGTTLVTC